MSLYTITRRETGDMYVGIATDPMNRWSKHQSVARRGGGFYLQRAMHKHGVDAFDFRVEQVFPNRELAALARKSGESRASLMTFPSAAGAPLVVEWW